MFGITLVDVGETKHQIRIIATNGQETSTENSIVPPEFVSQYPDIIPHLCLTWFEARSLPYNGPMEEFSRKHVRNDYPLLRLQQLGIKTVRTPFTDFMDSIARSRMRDWASLGFKFVLFTIGIPTKDEKRQVLENTEFIFA